MSHYVRSSKSRISRCSKALAARVNVAALSLYAYVSVGEYVLKGVVVHCIV